MDEYNAGSASSISADLTLEQDAAHVNMGGNWRMPTEAELQELFDNCDSMWTEDYNGTGVAGMIFTSKVNGKFVFFPGAGEYYNSLAQDVGLYGYYWTASCWSDGAAYFLYSNTLNYGQGHYGYSVRAVCE